MKLLLSIGIVALAFGFSSCKKCVTCTTTTSYSSGIADPVVVTSEFCGTNSDIEDFENASSTTATSGTVTVTTTASCK